MTEKELELLLALADLVESNVNIQELAKRVRRDVEMKAITDSLVEEN